MSDDKQNPDNNFAMIGGGILAGMIALGLLLLVAQPASGSFLWQWLANETLSPSETMRNYGLIAAGFIGLVLAYWRAHTADRDNRIAQEAHRREISKIDQERFQTGAVALGSESMTVRIAAISSLANLATEQRSSFYHQTVELLEAFARDRSAQMREKNKTYQVDGPPTDLPSPEDITHTVKTLLRIHSGNKSSKLALHDLYLCKSALTATTFDTCDLSRSDFGQAELSDTVFKNSLCYQTVFSSCLLIETQFLRSMLNSSKFDRCRGFEVYFQSCNLRSAQFNRSNISEVKFRDCIFEDTNISDASFENSEFIPTPETGLVAWANKRPNEISIDNSFIALFKPNDQTGPDNDWLMSLLSEMSWADAEAEYP